MSEDRSEQDPPRAKDDDEDDVDGHSMLKSRSEEVDSGSTESSHPDEGNPNPVEQMRR